ncbi:hypothetical protein BT69DRAFT_1290275 [Atractiella rhizophila]|nr:hypothetical protein BT69DRAFT_1290275 [Atractiella rhizophila]
MLPARDIVKRRADILREIENPKQDGGLVRAEAGEVMREIEALEIEAQNQEGNLVRVGAAEIMGEIEARNQEVLSLRKTTVGIGECCVS